MSLGNKEKLKFTIRKGDNDTIDILYRYGFHSFTKDNLLELQQTINDYVIENKLVKDDK